MLTSEVALRTTAELRTSSIFWTPLLKGMPTSLLSIVCIVQDASTLWVDARYVLRMWSVGDGDEVIRDGWLGARFVPLYIVSADLAEGIMGEVVAPEVG